MMRFFTALPAWMLHRPVITVIGVVGLAGLLVGLDRLTRGK